MTWIEPAIEDIATSGIIYYSEKYNDTCSRICEVLQIDLFPSTNHSTYWQTDYHEWEEKVVAENQKIEITTKAFSEEIITKIAATPSNILFAYLANHLAGILHFTNYANQLIYQSLYQNFYEFETNLREYLTLLGFTYNDIELYYEYSFAKSPKAFYKSRLEQLRSEKFKVEAKELSNFQKLDLKEALIFSKSSYHSKEIRQKIGLFKINEVQVSNLRNTVMHAKGITGSNSEIDHNFSSFEKIFLQVLSFKEAFYTLKKLRTDQINNFNSKMNDYTLALFDKLSDEELKTFFYTRN
ncbi:hypothetical protein [Pontibacter lucknowensis]|uniref:Uncharacterized protein n=1 Tax=Pontibacter lucknowensis TaxID=1077936 RepID=A0A1N6TJG9_9BACT|nr:hypothetical protein [Pontibacter lucknowensis]SIQ53411.1 hypothetical protein SAMN05421545_0361 [Pontibacter lucknowensis]